LSVRVWMSLLSFICGAVLIGRPSFARSTEVLQKIAVFDAPQGMTHSQQVLQLIKKYSKGCQKIQIDLFPIYDRQGHFLQKEFLEKLKTLDSSYTLIHLSWNLKMTPELQPLLTEMNRLSSRGVVIVAASGEPQQSDQIAFPIEETIMGQVQDAVLVGELDGKNKLPRSANYGSRIVAAFHPSSSLRGSSFTAPMASGKIAAAECHGISKKWANYFLQVKTRSLQSWPSLEEYFHNF